jgi:FAD synthetase
MVRSMKRILVFGTFDVLHSGHLEFLKQVKRKEGRLVVSLARDSFVRRFKGKDPKHTQKDRARRLLRTGLVDGVRLSDRVPGSYRLVLRLKPDLICLGYDQQRLEESLRSWLKARGLNIPVERLPFYTAPDRPPSGSRRIPVGGSRAQSWMHIRLREPGARRLARTLGWRPGNGWRPDSFFLEYMVIIYIVSKGGE